MKNDIIYCKNCKKELGYDDIKDSNALFRGVIQSASQGVKIIKKDQADICPECDYQEEASKSKLE